jgi:protein-S-isoprenylcysteine O-methyltransferase Ste14
MPSLQSLALLTLLWICYFVVHTGLASLRSKRWMARYHPRYMPWYRLTFNLQAILCLIPPVGYMWSLSTPPLWEWRGITAWVAYGLSLLALIGFVWSLRYYDGKEFLGVRQIHLRIQQVEDQERFHISPLHRYVRHPWYSLGLVLIWSQEMDPARLLSACLITGYFIIGSRIEEVKLLRYHGERYRIYRDKVPALIPRPWRRLSRRQAHALAAGDAGRKQPPAT